MRLIDPVATGWIIIVLLLSSSSFGLIDYRAQGQAEDGGLLLEGDSYLIRNEARADGPVSFGLTQHIEDKESKVFLGLDAPGEAAAAAGSAGSQLMTQQHQAGQLFASILDSLRAPAQTAPSRPPGLELPGGAAAAGALSDGSSASSSAATAARL